ncbi:DUF2850 domain-containing protein [Vibrio palustris]|uniref:DUF2850 domain-containing protein n=1 Tax=Vibrio palustris TaxID=1918946 RepID=A0A1R4B5L2_9VIBR|nr:DUF2850 domain-containing protein [Vibrio palustris]SJL84161.1 hypothetical protein VPAL9027_02143 [Vibrio palustris]
MKKTIIEKLLNNEVIFKSVALTLLSIIGILFGCYGYSSYQDYINPKQVYGKWIEIGVPSYDTEVMTLSDRGVYQNNRLISTKFKFDGTLITIKTGEGVTQYERITLHNVPKLKLITPNSTSKMFVKEGFVDEYKAATGSSSTQQQRLNLSEYFQKD